MPYRCGDVVFVRRTLNALLREQIEPDPTVYHHAFIVETVDQHGAILTAVEVFDPNQTAITLELVTGFPTRVRRLDAADVARLYPPNLRFVKYTGPDTEAERTAVLARLAAYVNTTWPYSVVFNNCQHFCYWARFGVTPHIMHSSDTRNGLHSLVEGVADGVSAVGAVAGSQTVASLVNWQPFPTKGNGMILDTCCAALNFLVTAAVIAAVLIFLFLVFIFYGGISTTVRYLESTNRGEANGDANEANGDVNIGG